MMSEFSFNLIEEPWIPCAMRSDGSLRELGLRQLFALAPEIREVVDASPLVTISLHRLLLAILHRNVGPASLDDWADLWQRGAWEADEFGAYFEKWRHRFDLFDDEWPFYQTVHVDHSYARSIALMVHGMTLGNYATLFDHSRGDEPPRLTPAQAARHLLAGQSFGIGGMIPYQSRHGEDVSRKFTAGGPLTTSAVALVKGDNLFETLMLNLQRYDGADHAPFDFDPARDRPAWERDEPTEPVERRPDGYLDLLTWQSRRIRLFPEFIDGRPVVSAAVVMKGYQVPDGWQAANYEQMTAFRKSLKPKPDAPPWFAVSFQEDRALWRDSQTLFQSQVDSVRPKVLDWVDGLTQASLVEDNTRFALDLCGMATDQANILLWRHERLPLPLALLHDKELYDQVGRALKLAEDVGRLLGSGQIEVIDRVGKRRTIPSPMRLFAETLAKPDDDAKANPDTVRGIVKSLAPGQVYWPRLALPFAHFVADLPQDAGAASLPRWAEEVRRAARGAFDGAVDDFDTSARALKARARAEREFSIQLARLVSGYLPDRPDRGQPKQTNRKEEAHDPVA